MIAVFLYRRCGAVLWTAALLTVTILVVACSNGSPTFTRLLRLSTG